MTIQVQSKLFKKFFQLHCQEIYPTLHLTFVYYQILLLCLKKLWVLKILNYTEDGKGHILSDLSELHGDLTKKLDQN